MRSELQWFWLTLALLGFLGFLEPVFFAFFAFALFAFVPRRRRAPPSS